MAVGEAEQFRRWKNCLHPFPEGGRDCGEAWNFLGVESIYPNDMAFPLQNHASVGGQYDGTNKHGIFLPVGKNIVQRLWRIEIHKSSD